MNKIKIFSIYNGDPRSEQEKINEWIEKNDIDVIRISQSHTANAYWSISLLYAENSDRMDKLLS